MELQSWLGQKTLVVDATELGNNMRELNHYQVSRRPSAMQI